MNGSFGHDGRAVLTAVNLTVHRGDVVALLGANGSGKSTLVRGMLGLSDHLDGEVRFFGVDAASFHERWRIGYVPQRHTVTSAVPATVSEVVAAGRLSRRRAWLGLGERDRTAVDAAIATVGMAGLGHHRVSELSGGQQRRVLIARALASEPELLVLDEPTAGVDADHQTILADTLGRLASAGATVILVAHELGPAEPVITRSVVLEGGVVSYDGPPLPDVHVHRHDDHDGDHLHAHGAPAEASGLGLRNW